jgi:hypothetical protein
MEVGAGIGAPFSEGAMAPAALPVLGLRATSLEPASLPSLDQQEAEEEYRAVGRSAVRLTLSDCWEANGKGPTRDGALLFVQRNGALLGFAEEIDRSDRR